MGLYARAGVLGAWTGAQRICASTSQPICRGERARAVQPAPARASEYWGPTLALSSPALKQRQPRSSWDVLPGPRNLFLTVFFPPQSLCVLPNAIVTFYSYASCPFPAFWLRVKPHGPNTLEFAMDREPGLPSAPLWTHLLRQTVPHASAEVLFAEVYSRQRFLALHNRRAYQCKCRLPPLPYTVGLREQEPSRSVCAQKLCGVLRGSRRGTRHSYRCLAPVR